jgi:hypothetical protein
MNTIATKTWYLEMKAGPDVVIDLPFGFSLTTWKPSVEEYLNIYKAVGSNYNWFDRLLMQESKLSTIINDPKTELIIFKYNGEAAGFAECDHSVDSETELVYFGLTSKYTGRKAGYPLLMNVVSEQWKKPINRLWLHTCDLDHPAALPMYQKAGFVVYKTEIIMQPVLSNV